MSWRDDPITEKQEELIAQIEEDACMNNAFIPPFHGKTKGEASDWISAFNGQQYHSLYNPHEDAGDRI